MPKTIYGGLLFTLGPNLVSLNPGLYFRAISKPLYTGTPNITQFQICNSPSSHLSRDVVPSHTKTLRQQPAEVAYSANTANAAATPIAPIATSVLMATFPLAVGVPVAVPSADVTRPDADAKSAGEGLLLTAVQICGAISVASVYRG